MQQTSQTLNPAQRNFNFKLLLAVIAKMPVDVDYIRIHECYLEQFLNLPYLDFPFRVVFDPAAPSPVTIMFFGAPHGTERFTPNNTV